MSGSKAKRLVLDAILARMRSGDLGGIVVAKLDRLSRMTPKDRVLLFEEVESAGGVILSASEQLDPSTPEGRFARDVFLGIARMQWEKYRDGFETAKRGSVAAGVPINTRAAVGYRKGEDRRLVPDPVIAPTIREVFVLRAAGAGPSELAELLRERGVTTSQGSTTWSKQAVYNLLSNRVYLGELSYGLDARYVNPAAHEPLVDLATWIAAQQPRGRRPSPTRLKRHEHLLVGLVRCQGCRYALQGTTSSHGHRIYRCTRRHSGGLCSAPARLRAELLEAVVLSVFWSWAEDVYSTRETVEQTDVDLGELEAALELAKRRVAQAMSPEVQDAAGDAWADMIRERREQLDTAAAALTEAKREAGASQHRYESAASLHDAYLHMSTADRRELVADVLNTSCISVAAAKPRQAVIYQRGTEPPDLPRRGFKAGPVLVPFPVKLPADALVLDVEAA